MRRILPILICLMATKVFAAIPTFGSFDTNTLSVDQPGNFIGVKTNWVQGIINATPNVSNAVTNVSGLVVTNETRAVVISNALNQFTGTFTGNGGGLTNISASGVSNFTSSVSNTVQSATNTYTGTVNAIVQSATNNTLATATNSFLSINTPIPTTNGFVTGSITNGLATTNFVNTVVQNGTNNLLASITNYMGNILTNLNGGGPTSVSNIMSPSMPFSWTNGSQAADVSIQYVFSISLGGQIAGLSVCLTGEIPKTNSFNGTINGSTSLGRMLLVPYGVMSITNISSGGGTAVIRCISLDFSGGVITSNDVFSATNNLLTTATNSFDALGAALAATNNFVGTVNGTVLGATNNLLLTANANILSATNNALATATNSFDAAGAALAATNAFASGELASGTNAAVGFATAATNNFGRTVAVNMTNAANAFTGTYLWGTPSLYCFFAGNAGHLGQLGSYNVGIGNGAQAAYTVGSYNTAFGNLALFNNSTGSNNIALGNSAGYNLTTGSSNIDIGNLGIVGENNTIRIGTPGVQTNTVIAGVINGNGGGLTNLSAATTPNAIGNNGGAGTNLTVYGTLTSTNLNSLYDTNGAAQSATNNFGNSVAVTMTNAANQFSGTFTNGTYFGNGGGLTNISASGVSNFTSSVSNTIQSATNTYTGTVNAIVQSSTNNALATATNSFGALGAVVETVTAKTTTYTVLATDSFLTGSGTFTFTLPTAVGVSGKVYTIKNIGTGVITIACNGAQTIDGVATYVIRTTNNGVAIISDGSNWQVKGVF